MPITGGIKFFDQSQCLLVNGSLAVSSSAPDSAKNVLGLSKDTFWRSVGSSDAVSENIVIDFPSAISISRLLLLNHNLKDYTIKYDVSGSWTDFTSVVGITGSNSKIAETAYSQDSSYYEFTPVTTESIQIVMNKTQIADQDKYINQVIATNELGTMNGYPTISEVEVDRNMRSTKTLSGKFIIQKSIETMGFKLQLKKYPTVNAIYNNDIDLLMSLHDRELPFLAWLCGGKSGSSYFNYTIRGFRVRDVLQMQIIKALGLSYQDNIYKHQVNTEFDFWEHI